MANNPQDRVCTFQQVEDTLRAHDTFFINDCFCRGPGAHRADRGSQAMKRDDNSSPRRSQSGARTRAANRRDGIATRYTSVLLGRVALGALAWLVWVGCSGTEDGPPVDDDPAVYEHPGCDDLGDWLQVPGAAEPAADLEGYPLDVVDMRFSVVDSVLRVRLEGLAAFDDDEVFVDLWIGDGPWEDEGTAWYTLSHWTGYDAGPVLLLEFDGAQWHEMSSTTAHRCDEDEDALVLGVDLRELHLDGLTQVWIWAGVQYHGQHALDYSDICPDTGPVSLPLSERPALQPSGWAVGDSENGATRIEPGIELELHADVHNAGLAPSAAGITGTLAFSPDGDAGGLLGQATATYHGGESLAAGEAGATDAPFRLTIDDSADTGDVVQLDLALTDDDGTGDTVPAVSLLVGGVRVGEDPDDHNGSFDLADLQLALIDEEWVVLVTSHGVHDGQEWILVAIDLDGDGEADHIVSTFDLYGDTFDGVVYDGHYNLVGPLDRYRFEAGTNHVLMGLALLPDELPDEIYLQAVAQDPFSAFSGRDLLPDADAPGPWILLQL